MVAKSISLGICPGFILVLLSSYANGQRTRDIRPAAANVATDSAAGVELFSNEAIQLTESVLMEMKDHDELAQYAPLFAFGNDDASVESSSERAEDCKTYPGDPSWPSADLWEAYDDLLGNALSPIIPMASPCYVDSAYDNYDASLCASVTEGWAKESTQLVAFLFTRLVRSQLAN